MDIRIEIDRATGEWMIFNNNDLVGRVIDEEVKIALEECQSGTLEEIERLEADLETASDETENYRREMEDLESKLFSTEEEKEELEERVEELEDELEKYKEFSEVANKALRNEIERLTELLEE